MNQTECHKVFAFPTQAKAREMLKYARPDQAGRQFNDAYRCRIPSCHSWHLTTKIGAPLNRAARETPRNRERNT